MFKIIAHPDWKYVILLYLFIFLWEKKFRTQKPSFIAKFRKLFAIKKMQLNL